MRVEVEPRSRDRDHMVAVHGTLTLSATLPTVLQDTNLSSSRNFKVPGYSVFRADRPLTRRGPATVGNQNGGGVLTLINLDLSFQMVPLSDPASEYLCVKINFQK